VGRFEIWKDGRASGQARGPTPRSDCTPQAGVDVSATSGTRFLRKSEVGTTQRGEMARRGEWPLRGPISADMRHVAASPAPRLSPPGLWVPRGHALSLWRPGGTHRRPNRARFSRQLGRRSHWCGRVWVIYTRLRTWGGSGRYLQPLGLPGATGVVWGASLGAGVPPWQKNHFSGWFLGRIHRGWRGGIAVQSGESGGGLRLAPRNVGAFGRGQLGTHSAVLFGFSRGFGLT